jgi:hypothetical protein
MVLTFACPARAQYITPFNSWNFTAPPPGDGKSVLPAKGPETCVAQPHGRDSTRNDCKPAAPKPSGQP